MRRLAWLPLLALIAAGADERLERFNEAKVGMFIHWGPYSLAGVEASWPIMTPSDRFRISEADYRALPQRFNPVNFDPRAFTRLAREAGQRYIVFTSKHHDGFCMFDCEGTDYKITKTPFGKDIAAQLAEAARAEGIPLGFYYSPPDMNHPGYRDISKLAAKNWHGEPQRPEWPTYLDYMERHLRQLLTKYGPVEVVWFDGLDKQEKYNGARFHNLIHELQPQALINNRIGLTGDYVTPEQRFPRAIPVKGAKVGNVDPKDAGLVLLPPRSEDFQPWETCETINDTWAYNPNDTKFKSSTELIRTLIEVASRGGNFLLNVGPRPDGTIQPEFVERLREMGRWLRANGDAIYGSTYGPLQGVAGIRTTAKGGTVFVHVFDWPKGPLTLNGLPPSLVDAQILASGERLPMRREGSKLVIDVPAQAPDPHAAVIALRPVRFPKPNPEGAFAGLTSPARRERPEPNRAEVDDWMAKRHDRLEWITGWWHEFVSPKDGSFLTFTPDPPTDLPPKAFGGWVFVFRGRHAEKIYEAARLAQITGEKKYADWASAQLDWYADNYMKWPVQTEHGKSRLMGQGLDEANILVRFVAAARLLPDSKRADWYARLFRPMAEILDETFQRIHNIAVWQRSAMAVAALYGRDEETYRRAIDGPYGIRRQMQEGVTSDYFWFEQSLGYNSYVVSALQPLFEALDLAGKPNDLATERTLARNLSLAPLLLRWPDNRLPTPADQTGIAGKVRAPVMPTVTSRNFESTRFAVLKQGPWQVFFHYGQLDASHAQAEALNYEVYFNDIDVSHDPGTVGYGSPLHTNYYRTAKAHNVPLVDGEGQARWQTGELVEYTPTRVKARQPLYRPDASAERELEIKDGQLIDRVNIKALGHERRLGLYLHLQGRFELPPITEAVRSIEVPVQFGAKTLKVRVECSGPMRVSQELVPDAPPNQRQRLYFETLGAEATFVTSFREAGSPGAI